jgi:hypothetical protein
MLQQVDLHMLALQLNDHFFDTSLTAGEKGQVRQQVVSKKRESTLSLSWGLGRYGVTEIDVFLRVRHLA